jgi:anti-anti-sigma regulatory factor
MLKISMKDTKSGRVLTLEGKLIAPWTQELIEIVCQVRASHPRDRELVIDLQEVTDISADGEEALRCLMVQGAKFRGSGVFMKQVLKHLAQRARHMNPLQEGKPIADRKNQNDRTS